MDTLTHVLVPFAVFALLQRPVRERAAAAVGGAAPDLDGLFAWMSHLDPSLYFLVHRGASHTPWGGFVLAVALYAALQHRSLAARWPRFRAFSWAPGWGEEAALMFGVLSHLVLDALTITGVPALWPFSADRVALNFYFFSVPWLLPLSGWLLWRRWRGRLSDRGLRRGVAVVVVLLLLLGGVRLFTYPRGLAEDALVEPTPSDRRWSVAEPLPDGNGFAVYVASGSSRGDAVEVRGNATAEALANASRLRTYGPYLAWSWDGSGAVVVNATASPGGGWDLVFIDAVRAGVPWEAGGFLRRLFDEPPGPWEDEALRVRVEDGVPRLLERPRGWVGS